jgi:hypothetical protein
VANSRGVGVRSPGGLYKITSYPVHSNQTFLYGDFVLFSSTGLNAMCALSTAFTAATTTATCIAGQAQAPAVDSTSGLPNTSVPVIVPTGDVEFILPLYSATAASAVPKIAQLGTKYGGYQTSGNYPAVNLDDTTNNFFRVTDFYMSDYAGWPNLVTDGTTQYAWVYAVVLSAASMQSAGRS